MKPCLTGIAACQVGQMHAIAMFSFCSVKAGMITDCWLVVYHLLQMLAVEACHVHTDKLPSAAVTEQGTRQGYVATKLCNNRLKFVHQTTLSPLI